MRSMFIQEIYHNGLFFNSKKKPSNRSERVIRRQLENIEKER